MGQWPETMSWLITNSGRTGCLFPSKKFQAVKCISQIRTTDYLEVHPSPYSGCYFYFSLKINFPVAVSLEAEVMHLSMLCLLAIEADC